MADYRFSASVISRGKGQSSVASAAYRSASRLVDERTGEIHDYGRKGGVLHSEVMTPEGTPEWMSNRQQLWSAVEAVETRKNSQLAREIQLSLPHELDQAQRKALLLDFVQEQFVNQGMIADIAIHAPDKDGDQRNHHAHIMLTMRELTGEGFHPKKATEKARSWNDDDTLAGWREQWAQHQNRSLERHGHAARVDHRSYESQGVDREPSQHLGPVANDMERNGKASRIGDENREIDGRNSDRANDHQQAVVVQLEIEREKRKFGAWADYKGKELEAAQELSSLDLDRKHVRQTALLNADLEKTYGGHKATIAAEIETLDRRLEQKGVRKILRDVFGRSRTDKTARENLLKTLTDIERRENEQRGRLDRKQAHDLAKEQKRQQGRKDALKRGIDRAKDRREATGWQARQSERKSYHRPDKRAPEAPTTKKATKRAAKPESLPEPSKPSLADLKTAPSEKPELGQHGSLSRPWQSSVLSNDNKRPWESDLFSDKGKSRERGPAPSPDGGGKDGGGGEQ